jgi:hypothetical protein
MSKNNAPWKKNTPNKRRVHTRVLRDRILIVCEGKCTEPNYFKAFPINKKVVEINIEGLGANTDSLVQEAIRLKKEAIRKHNQYNQVWCVFDRDAFSADNFNRAFLIAQNEKIKIAYTNQAFELWYLLHFHFFHTALSRDMYIEKLDEQLNWKYEKNTKKMYKALIKKQPTAIKNAQKLLGLYSNYSPEKNNPSTTVHELVIELNKFIDQD